MTQSGHAPDQLISELPTTRKLAVLVKKAAPASEYVAAAAACDNHNAALGFTMWHLPHPQKILPLIGEVSNTSPSHIALL